MLFSYIIRYATISHKTRSITYRRYALLSHCNNYITRFSLQVLRPVFSIFFFVFSIFLRFICILFSICFDIAILCCGGEWERVEKVWGGDLGKRGMLKEKLWKSRKVFHFSFPVQATTKEGKQIIFSFSFAADLRGEFFFVVDKCCAWRACPWRLHDSV